MVIYGQPKRNWSAILRNTCPFCGAPLIERKAGLACATNEAGGSSHCEFFIKHETAEKLIKRLKEEHSINGSKRPKA